MAKIYLRGKMYYSNYRQGGRRIRKPLSENKRTAEDMLKDIVAARRAIKSGLIPQNVSWRGFKAKHLLYAKAEKAEQTQYRDALAFRMVEQFVPITELNQMTPDLLREVVYKWKDAGMKAPGIARAVEAIKAAMHRAEDWKLIPMQNWRIVKVEAPVGRMLYYSVKEFEKLLKKARGRWFTALLLMGRAGLRSGEARHLEWQDINWADRTIWIRVKPCSNCKPCRYAGNLWRPKNWKPKSPKERFIDMPKDLEAHLRSLPNKQGLILGPETISSAVYEVYLRRIIKNAGLKGSPHTLRHTYATHLVPVAKEAEIGALLGHTEARSTRIYSHVMPHTRRKAVDRLPKIKIKPVAALWPVKTSHRFPGIPRVS